MTHTENSRRKLREIQNFVDQIFSPYYTGNLQAVGELAAVKHHRRQYALLSQSEKIMRGIETSHE